ncbi:unnamed protein product [Alternaria burnsii]|nr:unnamed protein product [Alternaria burnsii]
MPSVNKRLPHRSLRELMFAIGRALRHRLEAEKEPSHWHPRSPLLCPIRSIRASLAWHASDGTSLFSSLFIVSISPDLLLRTLLLPSSREECSPWPC